MTTDGFDDYPDRHATHVLDDQAVDALRGALDGHLWLFQESQRRDYGVDVRLEALADGNPTNFHVHVQVKGTDREANADGSVSVSGVPRTNLNYLLSQPDSVYVCFHRQSQRLLVRRADDVGHRATHGSNTLTVRAVAPFDDTFQLQLNRQVLATGRARRNERLAWEGVVPPERAVLLGSPPVHVPRDRERAAGVLLKLYENGHDLAIYAAYEEFKAVLAEPRDFIQVHLAAVNVGLNDPDRVDPSRVRDAVRVIKDLLDRRRLEPGEANYALGNGHLALAEHDLATAYYMDALPMLAAKPLLQAMCHKNLGGCYAATGDLDAAASEYVLALDRDPTLPEAHLASALLARGRGDYGAVLRHLDAITCGPGTAVSLSVVQGWRAEALLQLGQVESAFRDIRGTLADRAAKGWAWLWAARLVAGLSETSEKTLRSSRAFWIDYLRAHPDDSGARAQLFKTEWSLAMEAEPSSVDLLRFWIDCEKLGGIRPEAAPTLWDKVGHLAGRCGDMRVAVDAFQRATTGNREYGCCLATAYNDCGRFREAAELLAPFAAQHPDDAVVHFQLAYAVERLDDVSGAEFHLREACRLDPAYEVAWFNLGGVLWNSHRMEEAVQVWSEAVRCFPTHELARKLRLELPMFFNVD